MLTLLAIIANAFGRRFAGGLAAQWAGNRLGGTQVARLMQATIVGGTVAVLAPVWWWGLVAVPLAFAGATVGFLPRGNMMPVGIVQVLEIGVLHGMLATAPLAAAAWLVGLSPLWLLAAGLLRGPAYWGAMRWTPHCPALGLINLTSEGGPIDPPPFAEFISGGLLGLALALTL